MSSSRMRSAEGWKRRSCMSSPLGCRCWGVRYVSGVAGVVERVAGGGFEGANC